MAIKITSFLLIIIANKSVIHVCVDDRISHKWYTHCSTVLVNIVFCTIMSYDQVYPVILVLCVHTYILLLLKLSVKTFHLIILTHSHTNTLSLTHTHTHTHTHCH